MAAAAEGLIRILSYNVWAGNYGLFDAPRCRAQIKQVQALNCDVICLQEVFLEDVIDAYASAFKDTHQMFVASQRSAILHSPNPLGLAVLIRRSMSPIFHSVHEYETKPSLLSLSWQVWVDHFLFPRGAMVCSFGVNKGRDRIVLVNTHLSIGGPEADDCRNRQLQECLPELMQSHSDVIVCGDFNTCNELPVISEYGFKTKGQGELTTWAVDNPLTRGWIKVDYNLQVDYIYISDELWDKIKLSGWTTVLKQEPLTSDHFGVLSMLGLPR